MFSQLKQHNKTPSLSLSTLRVVSAQDLKITLLAPRPWLGDRSNYEGKMKNLKAQPAWPQTKPCVSGQREHST